MPIVQDILYAIAFLLGGFIIPLRWRLRRKRKLGDWPERCGKAAPREGDRPCLWVHGVSVGEVHSARTLVDGFAARHPGWDIVISTVTDTGKDAAARLFPGCRVIRFPIDFSRCVRRSLDRIRPTLIVQMEGDVWPNFVAMAESRGIPVVIVSGRMRDNSFPLLCAMRFFMKKTFARFARVAAQNDEYARRFVSLGVPADRVVVTGSLKWDAVPSEAPDPRPMRRALGMADDETVLLAASTHSGEEAILLDAWMALRPQFPKLRLVVVPRRLEEFDLTADAIRARGLVCVRRSSAAGEPAPANAVILGDSMGEMMTYYALSDVAFVGKSLIAPGGGQNMIEPAGLGKPVLLGPHTSNFQQVVEALVSAGGAIEVKDASELASALKQLLADEPLRASVGAKAKASVDAHRGATARSLDILEEVLASAGKIR